MRKSLFIFGSCVTRDAFGSHNAHLYNIETYVARSSLGSAFGAHSLPGININNISSPFQREMVKIDINKELKSLLLASKADVILIDMIDERFDLFQSSDGAVCTISNELRKSGFEPDAAEGSVIKSGSEAFYVAWERGWSAFITTLIENALLPRLRINRVYWSPTHEDGSLFLNGYRTDDIVRANHFLQRLYQRMNVDLNVSHFIDFPKKILLASLNHKWGSSPFHYIEDFYRHMTKTLNSEIVSFPQSNFSIKPASGNSNSPDLLLNIESVILSAETTWYNISAPTGTDLTISYALKCHENIKENRALICLRCQNKQGESVKLDGFATSHDPAVGQYVYLSTVPGESRVTFRISIPIGFKIVQIGVRDWNSEGSIVLEQLSIRLVTKGTERKLSKTLISVDVEALPGRATEDPTGRLIFGDYGDGRRVGVERLCDLFDRFKVRATFFVDYSTCCLYGDEEIFRASRLIRDRGHDVQLHMHSEVLVREKKWAHKHYEMPTFENLDQSVMQACLEYGMDKFYKNLGYSPRIFRPGGLYRSGKMVRAVKDVGMVAVSSIFRGRPGPLWTEIADQAVFQWNNGIKEIPLDFGLDPLITWSPTKVQVTDVLNERTGHKAINLLLHSTSLLIRDKDAKPSVFTGFHQPYEDQLIALLTWLSANTEFVTHSELLDRIAPLKTIELERYYPGDADSNAHKTQSNDPELIAPVTPASLNTAVQRTPCLTVDLPPFQKECPEQLLIQTVPPGQLPLKLAPGQRVDTYTFPAGQANEIDKIAYILTGHKLYFQCQRGTIPGGHVLNDAISALFKRHPRVELIIIESILETTPVTGYASKEEVRRTFVLDLPDHFEKYRTVSISKSLRTELERSERNLPAIVPGIQFHFVCGQDLDFDTYSLATELIDARLRKKLEDKYVPSAAISSADNLSRWRTHSHTGGVVHLSDANSMYAAALISDFHQECYFMGAGQSDVAPHHSLGKLLLYRLIQMLIGKGIKRLQMGGGDFGYKSRFGAIERPLFTFQFQRPTNDPWRTRVLDAIACGQSPAMQEQDIGRSMEVLLGENFEQDLKVDFNAMVELQHLGNDIRNRRYQATMKEAFVTLMNEVPRTDEDVFVDVGSGKGKMLYYAAQLGFEKCIGVELSASLIETARVNLQRMQLLSHVTLMERNASFLDPSELAQANIFYLYCPFAEEVMADFVQALVKSQFIRKRTVYLVYCNAQFQVAIRTSGFKVYKEFKKGDIGWRFDDSVIFSRDP